MHISEWRKPTTRPRTDSGSVTFWKRHSVETVEEPAVNGGLEGGRVNGGSTEGVQGTRLLCGTLQWRTRVTGHLSQPVGRTTPRHLVGGWGLRGCDVRTWVHRLQELQPPAGDADGDGGSGMAGGTWEVSKLHSIFF